MTTEQTAEIAAIAETLRNYAVADRADLVALGDRIAAVIEDVAP